MAINNTSLIMRFAVRQNYTNNYGTTGALCKVYNSHCYTCTHAFAKAKLQAQRPTAGEHQNTKRGVLMSISYPPATSVLV